MLDNDVVVFIIDENPDGRALSQRGNVTGIDPNRDYFVQSQPEQQNDSALMVKYLPTVSLEGHGYENPTLADGDTIPHNPGIDEDIFEHWNVQRVEQVRADFANDGLGSALNTIQSPIRTGTRPAARARTTTLSPRPASPASTRSDGTVTVNFTPTTSLMGNGDKVVITGNADGYNGTYTVTSPNSLVNTGVFQCKLTAAPSSACPTRAAATWLFRRSPTWPRAGRLGPVLSAELCRPARRTRQHDPGDDQ